MKKMSLRKTGSIFLLILSIGIVAAGCTKKEEPKESIEKTKESVESSSEETEVQSSRNTEDVIENVDYMDVVNDDGNIVIENSGYDTLKAVIREFNIKEAEYKKSKGIGEGSEYDINTRVVRADSKVFSIVSEERVYKDLETSSAENKYEFNTVNYNSNDGKYLSLSDVAGDGIYKTLLDELKATYPNIKFIDDAESKLKEGLLKQGWDSKAAWALSYDGIIFYIQEELVSSESKGVLVYSLSFNEHKDLIKQSYASKPENYIYPIFADANYPIRIGDEIVRFAISTEQANEYETTVHMEVAGKKTNPMQYMLAPSNIHLVNIKGEMFMLMQVPVGDVSYLTDIFKLDKDNGAIELNEVEQSVSEKYISNNPLHIKMLMLEGDQVKDEYMEFNVDGTFKKVE